jgi:RNA polymerase sigma-70 factor (ECF subfamily)
MDRPLPIDTEELLSHTRWMRALARSLVNDAASADDVVQESLAAALRRPPRADRPLHAWLSRVVCNVASNLHRAEQRSAHKHARRGEPEPACDPATTSERLETQRLVLELVSALEEPARTTIVLAYFEGLSRPEIGRRMGVSDATVRWRMQKALAD